MKPNLLDRLKPELLQAIEERYKDYPHLLDEIKQELANEKYFTDVSYGTYVELYFVSKNAFGSYERNFANYFTDK
jgi:hypothetical protein